MLKLKQHVIVNMFCDKLERMATKVDEGIYNQLQDPTSYKNITADVVLEYGYSTYKGDDNYDHPEEEIVKVEANDCGWGIQFRFHTSIGMIDGYWAASCGNPMPEGGEWLRVHDKFFDTMYDLLIYGVSPIELANERETMDPGDYHERYI